MLILSSDMLCGRGNLHATSARVEWSAIEPIFDYMMRSSDIELRPPFDMARQFGIHHEISSIRLSVP